MNKTQHTTNGHLLSNSGGTIRDQLHGDATPQPVIPRRCNTWQNMLTELIQMTPRSMAIIMIKLTSINRFSDLVIFAVAENRFMMQPLRQVKYMLQQFFMATNDKHVLITLNKAPLLIMIQRCTYLLQTSRKNAKY